MDIIIAFLTLLRRDLAITCSKPQQILNPLVFYVISCSLFPIGIAQESKLLCQQSGGILIVNAMLAVIIATDNLFKPDQADGSLERILISSYPTYILVLAKITAHWLISGFCLVLVSPILATMLHVPMHALIAVMLILCITTLLLTLISAIGASLTLSIAGSTTLNALVILPLYVPVLIFSSAAINAVINQESYMIYMLWLASILIISCLLVPIIVAYTLRALR